jgi:ABC-type hemin transport system substrate-binding protein
MTDELRDAIRDVARGSQARRREETFHAVTEERLRYLESQVQEVKARINGLIFVVLGAVTAQFLLKLME